MRDMVKTAAAVLLAGTLLASCGNEESGAGSPQAAETETVAATAPPPEVSEEPAVEEFTEPALTPIVGQFDAVLTDREGFVTRVTAVLRERFEYEFGSDEQVEACVRSQYMLPPTPDPGLFVLAQRIDVLVEDETPGGFANPHRGGIEVVDASWCNPADPRGSDWPESSPGGTHWILAFWVGRRTPNNPEGRFSGYQLEHPKAPWLGASLRPYTFGTGAGTTCGEPTVSGPLVLDECLANLTS